MLRDGVEEIVELFAQHRGRVAVHYRLEGTGCGVEPHQSATGLEGRPGGQDGRSGHRVTARHNQEPAIIVLMAIILAVKEPGAEVFGVEGYHLHGVHFYKGTTFLRFNISPKMLIFVFRN